MIKIVLLIGFGLIKGKILPFLPILSTVLVKE
ncbi:hypothetical protein N481_09790 [Pseudoalteromonas luteoviolacea S4047-1]|uniref:Uncharacterized protein n=1 Tax=Pseudoalteromonas luteoviolacea S4054 TaxID=1129367 RepID=A0A0F6AEJ8_9GAMM|nr:hypothetical protein N479_07975 [Pseudoalteromonas luteoviolacea S4054]KZN74263.1 hypothetical protein N481_09790 [Pseudoalteromonas luteoviolacea S4047-1]